VIVVPWQHLLTGQKAGAVMMRIPDIAKGVHVLPLGQEGSQLPFEPCTYGDLLSHRNMAKARRRQCAQNGFHWPPSHGALAPAQIQQAYR
jgi:hypothetical protein